MEEYGFKYSDEEFEEQDVDIGNQYYNFKDVIHWMWPPFSENWESWRSEDLNLSPYPFTGQDVYSIFVLPEEGKSPKCTPQLTFLSLLEVAFSSKNQRCLDAQLSCENCIDLKVDSEDAYSSCILDIDIEKGTADILKSSDETVGNSKSEGVVTASLMKRITLTLALELVLPVPTFNVINGGSYAGNKLAMQEFMIKKKHLLIAFGGLSGLAKSIEEDHKLKVYNLFHQLGLRHIFVVPRASCMIGVITRKDLLIEEESEDSATMD
ncbi:hypothetical protein CRYUN_Cryun15aG0067000 [Craigia yunnanensis]